MKYDYLGIELSYYDKKVTNSFVKEMEQIKNLTSHVHRKTNQPFLGITRFKMIYLEH